MDTATLAISQFTSSSTAAIASISIGFIPDYVEYVQDAAGTNPNVRYWTNKSKFSVVPDADDAILNTGSSGVLTQDTASISVHNGGVVVTAADVTARRYFKRNGTLHAAGDVTGYGITIPAGDQTNSGVNIVKAFRNDK